MSQDESTSLRLPEGTLARAGALVAFLKSRPTLRAVRVSRSAVLRIALLRGLDELECEAGAAR